MVTLLLWVLLLCIFFSLSQLTCFSVARLYDTLSLFFLHPVSSSAVFAVGSVGSIFVGSWPKENLSEYPGEVARKRNHNFFSGVAARASAELWGPAYDGILLNR